MDLLTADDSAVLPHKVGSASIKVPAWGMACCIDMYAEQQYMSEALKLIYLYPLKPIILL